MLYKLNAKKKEEEEETKKADGRTLEEEASSKPTSNRTFYSVPCPKTERLSVKFRVLVTWKTWVFKSMYECYFTSWSDELSSLESEMPKAEWFEGQGDGLGW